MLKKPKFSCHVHLTLIQSQLVDCEIGNRKLLTLAFSYAVSNRRDQISLLLLCVHMKELLGTQVKDGNEMSRVNGVEIQFQILCISS